MESPMTDSEFYGAITRSEMYRMLSRSLLYPTREVFDFIRNPMYSEFLSKYLVYNDLSIEFQKDVSHFQEMHSFWRKKQLREELENEYNRLFAHLGSAKCPPYETEYGYENIFQKTEAMADISGFYRAYGLDVSDINTERVDFIGTELEFMSYLAANEAYARTHDEMVHLEVCRDVQRKFLRDHLGRWITLFSQILKKSAKNPFYSHLGRLTEVFLDAESQALGVEVNKVAWPSKEAIERLTPFDCAQCSQIYQTDLKAGSGRSVKS